MALVLQLVTVLLLVDLRYLKFNEPLHKLRYDKHEAKWDAQEQVLLGQIL